MNSSISNFSSDERSSGMDMKKQCHVHVVLKKITIVYLTN